MNSSDNGSLRLKGIAHLTAVFCMCAASQILPGAALAQSTPQTAAVPQTDISNTYAIIIDMGLKQLDLARQLAKSPHDPVLIEPLAMLAATYETKGDYPAAITYYRKVLEVHEAILAENPENSTANTIFAFTKLGMLLHDRGRTHEAEPYVKRALQLRVRARGPQRVSLPDLLNNLAVIFQAEGRYGESEPLLRRALELREKEKNPLKLALTYNNLAELYVSMDQLNKAEPLHKRALKIRRRIAPNGPETALSLNNLAGVYHFQKRYAEAEPYFRQALKIWQDNFGPRHPYVAVAQNNLAALYLEQKRYDDAASLNRQVLEIRRSVLGPRHPDVAATLSNIAKVYLGQDRLDEAVSFTRQALAIDEQTQKPGHPFIRKNLKRLVELYGKLRKPDLAKPLQARLDAMPQAGMKHLPVFYVTNRAKLTTGGKLSYGGDAASKLNFGRATVLIPDTEIKRQAIRRAKAAGLLDHATGKLTAAAQLKLLRVQPNRDFAVLAGEAKQAMRLAGQFKDQLLIFVHGFNVSFEEALLRAAQISFDLEFDGVLMPFSWPSKGELASYQDDEKNAAAAAKDLVEMLRRLARQMPGKKVHFIAHSMGNRVLLRALDQLSRTQDGWQTVFRNLELGEIIWAHPDVDQADFSRLTKQFGNLGARMTLYSTRDDWALWASKLLHGVGRAGSALVTVPGVDTIDITGMKAVDRGWFEFDLNHNVFVRNPALFGEITRLLLTSRRPVHRRSPDFRAAKHEGKQYWRYQTLELARN